VGCRGKGGFQRGGWQAPGEPGVREVVRGAPHLGNEWLKSALQDLLEKEGSKEER